MVTKSYQMLVERSSNEMDFPDVDMIGPFNAWGEVYTLARDLIRDEKAKYVEIVSWTSGRVLAKLGVPWNESTDKPGS